LIPPEAPPRHLGLVDAIAIYAGIILGSGIFVAPAAVAAAAPDLRKALALWLAGGGIAACGAACYAECASRVPMSGGFFVFQRQAYGPAVAFVGGWAALLVTYPASIAAIALVFAAYFAEATGLAGHERLVAGAALLAASAVNAAGLRAGPVAQCVLTAAKVVALVLVALAALAAPTVGVAAARVAAPAGGNATWLGALLLLLWTYEGWSDVTLVAGEVRDPARNLGRAVLIGTAVLVVVYGLVQAAVLHALPGGLAAASMRPLADAAAVAWGPGAGRLVAVLVVASTFGSMLGVTLTVSRLAQAMAGGGAFPGLFAPFDPRLRTPVRSIAAVTAAAGLYIAVASFRGLLAYFTFSVWIFYGLTAVGLLILRRRRVGEAHAWRAPFGMLAPCVVLIVAVVVTTQVVAKRPVEALAGAAMLAAGFAFYALRWGRLRPVAAAEGSGATER
jgi:APA family basic amino acid/polyamine antiporter